ncbi:leucyl aminopeptidase family protein [Cohnella soli]|uniref:Probable cytosol aminopeptidase n=1 Tax=Cohnella soli TaxID=425005 RepID=A0ABW0HSS1_9BACL
MIIDILDADTVTEEGPSGQIADAEVCLVLVAEGETVPELAFDLRTGMTAYGKVTFLYGAGGNPTAAPLSPVALVGLGDAALLDAEKLRRAAGAASRALAREGFQSATVCFDSRPRIPSMDAMIEAWVEGWLLGAYTFNRYKSSAVPPEAVKLSIKFTKTFDREDSVAAVHRARLRAESTMLARDWVNEPANVLTPEELTSRIAKLFEGRTGTSVTVYRGDDLERHGMNGLRAVAQGSRQQPALVEVVYAGSPSKPLVALVGKGMTFDMGGMNVKTGRDLSEARFDMGGAGAVVGALDLLVRTEAPVNVVALIAVADNVPGAGALLPSSVVTYPNGLTVQVANTDAEGRMILADALLHAQRLGAKEIVDIATLTGSVGHALGLRVAGVWGDAGMAEELRAAGNRCGDRVWPMPLIDDDDELLRSDYADLSNISSSAYGGAGAAALFLRRFIGEGVRWTHIDMANTVQSPSDRGYEAIGATGFGVRLLADYVLPT